MRAVKYIFAFSGNKVRVTTPGNRTGSLLEILRFQRPFCRRLLPAPRCLYGTAAKNSEQRFQTAYRAKKYAQAAQIGQQYLNACNSFMFITEQMRARNDLAVSYLYQPAHPAVLRLLAHIIRTANRMNKTVSLCGEMAGDTTFTRLLLGMGLRSFSMNTNNLLAVKDIVIHSHIDRLEQEILRILRNEDPDKADKLLKQLNQAEKAV